MRQYGFLEGPETITVEQVLAAKGDELPPLITVRAHDKVRQAVDVLQANGISQAPVVREDSTDVAQFVGSIRDRELLERVFRDPDALQADVAEVMAPPIPTVERDASVDETFAELERAPAVLVSAGGNVLGVLTRSDLLDFLAHRRQAPARATVRALGIDVGGEHRKHLDIVVMDGDRQIAAVGSRIPVQRLRALIDDQRPDVIAIDAPPAWAPGGHRSRTTERELKLLGIQAYYTPDKATGEANTFYAWMRNGMAAFRAAERAGYPSYRAGRSRGTRWRSFPMRAPRCSADASAREADGRRQARVAGRGAPRAACPDGAAAHAGPGRTPRWPP